MADKDKKDGSGKQTYKDDYEMLTQVVADSPHLKRIVLDKLRGLKQKFGESALDQANRKERETRDDVAKKGK